MRKLLLVIPLIGLITSACATASAKAPADRPALTVPLPPPRVIESAVEVLLEPVADLPSATIPSRPTRPAAPKPEPPKPADPKTVEPPPAEAAPKDPPKSQPEAGAQLRTPQTADTSGVAKNVRATIDSARSLLNKVNYGPLSNERKKAYDDVKLFTRQAEDALKQGNLVFAQGVATKAETLARELAGK